MAATGSVTADRTSCCSTPSWLCFSFSIHASSELQAVGAGRGEGSGYTRRPRWGNREASRLLSCRAGCAASKSPGSQKNAARQCAGLT